MFREVAEEFSIARRDAMNFALLMVVQWFNTQRTELQAFQRQQVPLIQASLQQLLHETSLMNQLQQLLQQTRDLFQQDQNIPPQYEELLDIQAQIQNSLTEARPDTQLLDDLLLNLNDNNQVQQESIQQQRIQQENESLQIHLILLNLNPQFIDLKATAARATNTATTIKNTLEELLTNLKNQLPMNRQVALQNIRNARKLERKVLILRQRYATIIAERPLDQSDMLRFQTIRQVQAMLLTSQAALEIMREQEQQDRTTLDESEIAQEYIRNIQLLLQTTDIADNYTKLFQVVEITLQQITLALRDPEFNFTFPSITNETFWSHTYRRVCADPENLNRHITFDRSINLYFDDFDISRKRPCTNDYIYNLPVLDVLQKNISFIYSGTIIQNNISFFLDETKLNFQTFSLPFLEKVKTGNQKGEIQFRRIMIL